MRVLICGDRDWTDPGPIDTLLMNLVYEIATNGGGPLVVIQGGARGADAIARERCEYHDIRCEQYDADWTTYGPAAGPIRNERMLKEGRPDVLYAFHDDIEKSRGTKDMVNRARRAGVRCRIVTH
ncbi:MAG TPA: SLOG family protein [Acidimicrobiales bacterium]|nr:SLOG family protein [Acidimicrobiales bacterium]